MKEKKEETEKKVFLFIISLLYIDISFCNLGNRSVSLLLQYIFHIFKCNGKSKDPLQQIVQFGTLFHPYLAFFLFSHYMLFTKKLSYHLTTTINNLANFDNIKHFVSEWVVIQTTAVI